MSNKTQAELLVDKPKEQPTSGLLAQYIATYIEEEKDRGNRVIDSYMIQDAIEAYRGGAR
jgi:hypothetical protein